MSHAETILSRDLTLNLRLTSHLILSALNSWLGKKTRSNTPSKQIPRHEAVLHFDESGLLIRS